MIDIYLSLSPPFPPRSHPSTKHRKSFYKLIVQYCSDYYYMHKSDLCLFYSHFNTKFSKETSNTAQYRLLPENTSHSLEKIERAVEKDLAGRWNSEYPFIHLIAIKTSGKWKMPHILGQNSARVFAWIKWMICTRNLHRVDEFLTPCSTHTRHS